LRAMRPARDVAPDAAIAEPETELEELLAGIWRDLLGRERIGVDDNLFDLGAHSLLALQFTARVHEALELDVPLHLLFDSPTVRRRGLVTQTILIEQIAGRGDGEAELRVLGDALPGRRAGGAGLPIAEEAAPPQAAAAGRRESAHSPLPPIRPLAR